MNSKSNNNGSTTRTTKSRKGPKPIVSVAELRKRLLAEMMVKESRKIDRKISKLERKRVNLVASLHSTDTQLDNLRILATEYRNEAAKA